MFPAPPPTKQDWLVTASSIQPEAAYSPGVVLDILDPTKHLVANHANFWAPASQEDNEWIQIDFGDVVTVYKCVLFKRYLKYLIIKTDDLRQKSCQKILNLIRRFLKFEVSFFGTFHFLSHDAF